MTTQLTTISTPATSAPAEATAADAAPTGEAPPSPQAQPDAVAPSAAEPAAPKPEDGREQEMARRLEAASKREARTRRMEADWQSKMASFEEERRAFAAEREAFKAEREEWDSDPVGYALKRNKDPVAMAKRIAQPETEAEKRIRLLEETLKQREEREKTEREEAEARAREERSRGEMRRFVGEITKENSPHLTSLYKAQAIPSLVQELLHRVIPADPDEPDGEQTTMLRHFQATYNRLPTNAEIREVLEYEAELRAKEIEAELFRPKQAAPQAPSASTQSSQDDSGPNGISNQHGAVTHSGRKPSTSLEERRKKSKQELVAALEAGVADRD